MTRIHHLYCQVNIYSLKIKLWVFVLLLHGIGIYDLMFIQWRDTFIINISYFVLVYSAYIVKGVTEEAGARTMRRVLGLLNFKIWRKKLLDLRFLDKRVWRLNLRFWNKNVWLKNLRFWKTKRLTVKLEILQHKSLVPSNIIPMK